MTTKAWIGLGILLLVSCGAKASGPALDGTQARVGSVIGNPGPTKVVRPALPEAARAQGITGPVLVEVRISETGDVSVLSVVRGHPLLDDLANKAVGQWKFRPTLLEGRTIPVIAIAAVYFVQEDAVPQSPDELVQALGQFPAGLPGVAPSTGVLPEIERLRREVYDRLWSLGSVAVPALCRGLGDPAVHVRRNVALFLDVAGGSWYDRERPRLAIDVCVPALVVALADSDGRVKELAAQAVGATGAAGAPAVPALIGLLASPNEGERNTACIALGGIGPAAKAALPALKEALSDPSATVQQFARRAIARIDKQESQWHVGTYQTSRWSR